MKWIWLGLGLLLAFSFIFLNQGDGFQETLEMASDEILEARASDRTFDQKLLRKVDALPESIVAARFEVLEKEALKADVVLHWNAIGDEEDVGQLKMRVVQREEGWFFESP